MGLWAQAVAGVQALSGAGSGQITGSHGVPSASVPGARSSSRPSGPPTASTALPNSSIFCCLAPDPLRTIGFPGDPWAMGHTDPAGIPALPGHVTSHGKGSQAPVSKWSDTSPHRASGGVNIISMVPEVHPKDVFLSSLPSKGVRAEQPRDMPSGPGQAGRGRATSPSPPPTHSYLQQSWKPHHDSHCASRVPLCGEEEVRGLGWGPRGPSWWPPLDFASSAPRGHPEALGHPA